MTINQPDLIEGAAKAFAVLESFTAERQKLNTTQTAEKAGLTRAAARRHLLTLEHLGYLQSEDGFFWLAPRILRLAGNYLSSARLPRAAQPTLNRLARDTSMAFSVAILDGAEVVIVARSGEHRRQSAMMPQGIHLGARLPAYATSTGRVLLADLSTSRFKAIRSSINFVGFTPNTVRSMRALEKQMQEVRAQGHCAAAQEHELGVYALAVPIRDSKGKCIAALNIVQLQMQGASTTSQYLGLLLEASAEIRTLL